jgi:lipopolysaccharide assembly outer membrane protein LptD (OstA)
MCRRRSWRCRRALSPLPRPGWPLPLIEPSQSEPLLPGDPDAPIQFSADRVEYDENRETVTAMGDVFMFREAIGCSPTG